LDAEIAAFGIGGDANVESFALAGGGGHNADMVLRTLMMGLLVASPVLGQSVTFTVNATANVKPISPWIYGKNNNGNLSLLSDTTSLRLGGNRWTGYNWENNLSNAGSDYFFYNDLYLTNWQTLPAGGAVLPTLQSTAAAGQAFIATIPMAGYVSRDGAGEVPQSQWATVDPANPLAQGNRGTRFNYSKPRKGAAFSLTPNTTDDTVYQDEFINWVRNNQGANRSGPVMYMLDNESDLWSETHKQFRWNPATSSTVPVTYAEIRQRSIDYAAMIKDNAPTSMVLGPANYGWYGYRRFQGAPDAANRDFHQYYLNEMKLASQSQGRRLLDALDVHYYPEAEGILQGTATKQRIIMGPGGTSTDPGVIAARVQAPRSMWDTTYVEDSWITRDWLQNPDKPIRLIPRIQADINAFYPGTKISITEYAFGGGNHISGAVAQADALGIFGVQGVFAANLWDLQDEADNSFTRAAFAMFLNFNGAGAKFGDISVSAASSNIANASIYAALDSDNPRLLTLVAINRTNASQTATINLSGLAMTPTRANGWRLEGTSTTPTAFLSTGITGNSFTFTMAPYSVNTLAVTGFLTIPEPGALLVLPGVAVVLLRRRG
jgi:hypothetical protein